MKNNNNFIELQLNSKRTNVDVDLKNLLVVLALKKKKNPNQLTMFFHKFEKAFCHF
jgi:hypothetical protein